MDGIAIPIIQEPLGAPATGPMLVLCYVFEDGLARFGVEFIPGLGLQECVMVVAVGEELAIFVVDPGQAAGHAGAKIDAGGS